MKSLIIGGGFFGCRLALFLKEQLGHDVTICEMDSDLMQRASYNNQARVHNGYHYPRSLVTALRSRVNFPVFCEEYAEAVDSEMTKYYVVAETFGKVTNNQFKRFFELIDAPMKPITGGFRNLFDPRHTTGVYEVVEYAFDSHKVKLIIQDKLDQAGIKPLLNTRVSKLSRVGGGIEVTLEQNGASETRTVDRVYNVTYANLNGILANSQLSPIPIKLELAEMCLVEVPELLKRVGITVMCGPFWSLMPFPDRGMHTFSHVRYTPHTAWQDTTGFQSYKPYVNRSLEESSFLAMQKDAIRIMPMMQELVHKDSLWELKAVLPASEANDSRPILMKEHPDMPGLFNILGGKLDNIYDMEEQALLYEQNPTL